MTPLTKVFSIQVLSGVLVVPVLMLGVFLKSSCTRLPSLALRSKMQRSTVGRFQSQLAMTGTSGFVTFRYYLVREPHYTHKTFELHGSVPESSVQITGTFMCMFQGNYGGGSSEPCQVPELGSQSSAAGQVSNATCASLFSSRCPKLYYYCYYYCYYFSVLRYAIKLFQ